jgi:hypothetical protein
MSASYQKRSECPLPRFGYIESIPTIMHYTLSLYALCVLVVLPVNGQTDLTLTADTYGPLVVETTIKLLRDACLINDHMFLRRVASFETKDGLAIMPMDHGGIWKVNSF